MSILSQQNCDNLQDCLINMKTRGDKEESIAR